MKSGFVILNPGFNLSLKFSDVKKLGILSKKGLKI